MSETDSKTIWIIAAIVILAYTTFGAAVRMGFEEYSRRAPLVISVMIVLVLYMVWTMGKTQLALHGLN